ncbi:MAG: hypothetical protein ABIS35_07455 [Terracoccus sp.]
MTSTPTSTPTTNIPVSIPAGSPRPGGLGSAHAVGAAGAPPPATLAGSIPSARTVIDRMLYGTPGRMRLLGLVAVIAAIAIGAVSASALLASRAAVERAANTAAQVVRAQSIQVELLRADALATNAFLVGGLESPASAAGYDEAISRVVTGLTTAAAAQPADAAALGALSDDVQTYTSLVEQARSNNRLGLPVGAQYLKEASAGLRTNAMPIIRQITSTNEDRAQKEFGRSGSVLLLIVGVVALVALVAVAVWLARRTHRYLNRSLTAGLVLLVVGLFAAATTITSVGSATAGVAANRYQEAVDLATVRTAANDARANESLTLISRGSGATFEKAWQANDATVTSILRTLGSGGSLPTLWSDYGKAHTEVRTLDDGGTWDQAVAKATDEGPSGSAGTFTAFDTEVSAQRDTASSDAVAQLTGLGTANPLYAIAIGIASLLAAWLIARGVGQRLEEYR